MSNQSSKTFNCVASMRHARDRISSEIESLSFDELVQWLKGHEYKDPHLKRLAERAHVERPREQPK